MIEAIFTLIGVAFVAMTSIVGVIAIVEGLLDNLRGN